MFLRTPTAIFILLLSGCSTAPSPAKQPDKSAHEVNFQRFVPISPSSTAGVPWNGFLALDTETGELCKTVNVKLTPPFDDLPLCWTTLSQNVRKSSPECEGLPAPKTADEFMQRLKDGCE